MQKLTPEWIAQASPAEFAARLAQYIASEEEYRIMSPPRRPRGEKPATTIRFLNRQIANLQASCSRYHAAIADKEKVIAGYDVQLSESQDETARIRDQLDAIVDAYDKRVIAHQIDRHRLSFLEGYYARSQEILPHDPAKTYRGSGSGYPQNLQDGAQGSEDARQEIGPGRPSPRTGGEIWRRGADYSARQERGSLEESAVMEAARDATQSEFARYRR